MPKITEARRQECVQAQRKAKNTLNKGDRIRASRCGDTYGNYIFDHWDGNWIVTASGINYIDAIHIVRLNGISVDFTDLG